MGKIHSSTPNFGSGLTSSLRRSINSIDVKQVEYQFRIHNVDAHFNKSKTIAASASFVANIMEEISNKYKLPFDALPPSIHALEKLTEYTSGMCNLSTTRFFAGAPKAIGRSIAIKKPLFDSPIIQSLKSDYTYMIGNYSSPHFLATMFHEWFHNIHFDLVYKKRGYDGSCPIMKKIYPSKKPKGLKFLHKLKDVKISQSDKEYGIKHFNKYSVINDDLLEFFAETMTKFTTEALDEKLNVVKNPLDNIPKDMPKFFKKFIEETLNI